MTKAEAAKQEEQEALKELGIEEALMDYKEAGLDKKFAAKVNRHQQIRQQIEALEKELKDLKGEVGASLETYGLKSVLVGDLRATVVDGVHRSLDKKKLLELGVSATTLLAATKESHFSTVTVTEIKKNK